ncbi:MAG: response regulator [Alphaproteobacteria bacterium]
MASILVIDDEPKMRDMLRLVLERAGHSVFDAPNGRAGAVVFRQNRIDLTISDILMPEQEGIETISELKRFAPRTKIIAISGGGRTKNLNFLNIARKLGADRTLGKPFRPREIVDMVDDLLGTTGDR